MATSLDMEVTKSMSTRIRLQRAGMKRAPFYRVVVADERAPRDGRFIELVGRYNPRATPSVVELDVEKVEAWIAKGAQPSEVVVKLLAIAKGEKEPPATSGSKVSKKTEAKAKADAEAAEKAAAEAAKAEADAKAAAAEAAAAPAEEEVAEVVEAEEAPVVEEAVAEEVVEEAVVEEVAEAPAEEAAAEEASEEADAEVAGE